MLKGVIRQLRKRPTELVEALRAAGPRDVYQTIAELLVSGELRFAPPKPDAAKIANKFYEYDKKNPHVAGWFLNAARALKTKQNRERYGIGALTEQIRWDVRQGTIKTDGFRISNDVRACYARQVLMRDPCLCGLFAIRPSVVDETLVIDGQKWSDFAIAHHAELWPEREAAKKPVASVPE